MSFNVEQNGATTPFGVGRLNPSQIGLASVVLAAVLWGTTGMASRLIPSEVPLHPYTFGFFRLAIGAPALFLCALLLLRGGGRLERRHLPLMGVYGGMIALYQICFFTSVEHLGVAVGTLIPLGTSPLFAAAIARVALGEQPPAGILLAGLTAITGVACLTGVVADPLGLTQMNLPGLAAGLAGGAAWAVVTVLGRVLTRRNAPPLLTTGLGFAIGAVVLLPLAAGDAAHIVGHWEAWPALLYLGLGPSALAYLLCAWGMGRVRTTAAGATTMLLEPAGAMVLASLLLGERLGRLDWAGVLLLALALLFLLRGENATE